MSGEGLTLKGIVGRVEKGGRIWRQLECGHEQVEPRGGRAPNATHAKCGICNRKPTSGPVLGKCTALMVAGRRCGKPAKLTKRGEPRCTYHYNRGAPDAPAVSPQGPDV